MSLNKRFLLKLADSLYSDEEDKQSFITALEQGQSDKQALCWLPDKNLQSELGVLEPLPFFNFTFIPQNEVSGSHELHQNGSFYLLDASSVLAISVLKAVDIKVKKILDVCAAPGGKSIVAWRFLQPEFLLSNETINKRVKILISNLSRCSIKPSAVSALDSKMLAIKYPEVFDLVVVDAPCSGQSLIARGEDAPGALNPVTINTNSNRQKRIIANAAKTVTPGGYLAYMTCTYSQEENEDVAQWFLKKFPDFQAVEVPSLQTYQSKYTSMPAYRLFPQDGFGAGAFSMLFKSTLEHVPSEFDFSNEKFPWQLG